MSSPICQGGDTVVSPLLVASGIRTICQKLRLVNSFWNTVSMFARWCAFLHRLSGAWPRCRGCTAYFPPFSVCLWNHKCLEAEVEYMLHGCWCKRVKEERFYCGLIRKCYWQVHCQKEHMKCQLLLLDLGYIPRMWWHLVWGMQKPSFSTILVGWWTVWYIYMIWWFEICTPTTRILFLKLFQ